MICKRKKMEAILNYSPPSGRFIGSFIFRNITNRYSRYAEVYCDGFKVFAPHCFENEIAKGAKYNVWVKEVRNLGTYAYLNDFLLKLKSLLESNGIQ